MQLPLIDPGGIWHFTFFVGISAGILLYPPERRHFLLLRLLATYILLYSSYILECDPSIFAHSFQSTAGQVLAEAIFIPVFVLAFYKHIPKIVSVVILYELFCVWINKPGLLVANSFDTAFCALGSCIVPTWLGLCILMTVICHHGTTAALVLGSMIAMRGFRDSRKTQNEALVALGAIFLAAWWHSGPMFDGVERIAHYKKYFTGWLSWKHLAVGVGPGTFPWMSMLMDNFKPPVFFQMHSDWLQILWELGGIGLVLCLLTWFRAMRLTWWRDSQCMVGLVGAGVFCISYHPLRFFPTAALICYFFMRAFYGRDLDER